LTLSAPTNFDAHNLSVAIRRRRRALGEVGEDVMTLRASDAGGAEARVFDLPLAVGDRVRLFQRTNAVIGGSSTVVGNIGRNGSVLEVRGISDVGLTLRAASGTEGLVSWSSLRDRASEHILLDYGEALTTNTAQGSTVTDHIHAIPGGTKAVSAYGAYTSGSRHRDQNYLVVSDGAERAEVAARRPLGDRREILVEDVLANIVRNLSREPRKESSLELLERADDLRRGSIRNLQGAAEAAQRPSGNGSGFARRLEEGRLRERLGGSVPVWTTRLKERAQGVGRAAKTTLNTVQQIVESLRARRARQARYWRDVADEAPVQSQNRKPKADKTPRQTRKL